MSKSKPNQTRNAKHVSMLKEKSEAERPIANGSNGDSAETEGK